MKIKRAKINITSLIFMFSVLIHRTEPIGGYCPSVCVCKWKYGKQAVECVNRALITIPDQVDMATQILDMTGNNLQILPRKVFQTAGLVNLQKIYLRQCQLGQIDDSAFQALTNLIELDLSNNLLTRVPSAALRDVPFLRDLVLSYNPIPKIEANAFAAVSSLIRLDMAYCDLQMISPQAFDGLELLEVLKINSNKLDELRPRTVDQLKRLRGVELHENPWICDCRMRAAKIWLSGNHIPYTTPPTCAGGPERIKHRKFNDLTVDDFACKPEILPVSRYIEAMVNENATILCRAGAVPMPIIKWYWNGKLLVNNTFFNAQQKIVIHEEKRESVFEKRSSLVLTNTLETESSEFYCVAENRAGSAEANFTLHVSLRIAGMASLHGSKIIGLSGILVCLTLSLLMAVLVLFVRFRRNINDETKSPTQVEVARPVIKIPEERNFETSRVPELNISTLNPIAKPPRSNETSNDDLSQAPMFQQVAVAPGNNPDLINDTRYSDAEENDGTDENDGLQSGEYRKICDSLYPSGLWGELGTSEEGAIKRLSPNNTFNYNDKTPIVSDTINYGEHCHINPCSQPVFNCGYPSDYGLPIVPGAGDSSGPVPMCPPESVLPMNAKTLRVWQKGGVPVLPPVTAIKRALTHRGEDVYQDGYGTNV